MSAGTRLGKATIGPLLLCAGLAGLAVPAAAQDDDEELPAVARAVVQPLPSQGSFQLNAALTRLAANPRDVSALLDAGSAALELGDTEAALGFYGRADQLSPNNPRVKSALGGAMVRNEDPFAAIPYFDAAERAGASTAQIAGERGLAYDLVGANSEAQRYYRLALGASSNPEITRRMALSLAIAGDRKGSDAALAGQLRQNDPAAWRTRAFALAILGDTEEAVKIANGTMPRDLSAAIVPYLRYMGRLTPAQQAAAANFGHFPRAAQIGRDDPRVARYAALYPRKPVASAVVAAANEQPAKNARKPGRERNRKPDRGGARALAQADTRNAAPTRVVPAARTSPSAGAAKPTPTPAPAPTPTPAPVRIAAATPNPLPQNTPPISRPQTVAAQPAFTLPVAAPPVTMTTPMSSALPPPSSAQVVSRPVAGPPATSQASSAMAASNLDVARQQQAAVPAVAATIPQPVAAPPPRRDLAASFADFRAPDEEQRTSVAAVDLSAIAAARTKKAPPVDRVAPADAPIGAKRVASADPAAATTSRKAAGKDAKLAAAKPATPSHPSRIWVQVGVGRNKGALAFDWRKYQKSQADLFKARKAWTTPWGQTNRFLIGPFDSQAAAQTFLKAAKKEDLDAFVWTSPAGQAVDALVAK